MLENTLHDEKKGQTMEALADVDAGRTTDHQAIQAWAESLSTDTPLPVPSYWKPASTPKQKMRSGFSWLQSPLATRSPARSFTAVVPVAHTGPTAMPTWPCLSAASTIRGCPRL